MSEKFDVVIGNPPYQSEAQGGTTRSEPLYHLFMQAAYELSKKAILITPARFLSHSGQTPSKWNKEMLADEHLRVAHHEADASSLFPGADIKGGVVVTYRDDVQKIGPIGTFLGAAHNGMATVLNKVRYTDPQSFSSLVSSRALYKYSDRAMNEVSQISALQGKGTGTQITPPSLSGLADIVFFKKQPTDEHEYVQLIGVVKGKRVRRWMRRDYLNEPKPFTHWNVLVAKSNNSGSFGETLSSPFIAEPMLGHTDTFLSIGAFNDQHSAEACLNYVKTKFTRALLSLLKTTQDNPKGKWAYVPLQDFTENSDIDWSKSIPEIDAQLYEKYGLNNEEIDFIESRVKPME